MGPLHAVFGRLSFAGLTYLCVIACLLGLGLLTGYSAAEDRAAYAVGALRWLLLALAAFSVSALLPLRWVLWLSPLGYAALLLLLAATDRSGLVLYGAKRWISIGGIVFQPGELAKLTLLVTTAGLLSIPVLRPRPLIQLVGVAVLCGPYAYLVLRQPDLGSAAVLLFVSATALFFGGFPVRYVLLLAALGVIATPFVLDHLAPYQFARLEAFVHPESDPLGAGWNVLQSKIAIGNGGIGGQGLLAGSQSQLGFLPVQESDFIFASFVEEEGMTGALLLLSLLALLSTCCIAIALGARETAAFVVAATTGVLIAVQTAVAVAMALGLAPVTGIPLPFIARGGSALVATMAMLGLVEGIRVRQSEARRDRVLSAAWAAEA